MHRTFITGTIVLLTLAPAGAFAASVDVPNHCTVQDTSGGSHTFDAGTYLGICALATAQAQGAVNAYTLDSFSFGLFLASLNGVAPGSTEYWKVSQNGAEAQAGLSDLTIAAGDTLSFQLTDWSTNTTVGSPVSFTIGSLIAPATAAPSEGSGLTLHDPFDLSLAIGYLWEQQHKNGSFGSAMLDDWAAIASAGGRSGDLHTHLRTYEISHVPTLVSTTDYERHAMALEALDIDPYSGTSIDTITPIVHAFDGTQIGDPMLVNDDIFAIFPLLHAGYSPQDPIIAKTAAFIVSRQKEDGSWEESADLTGAALQALSLVPSSATPAEIQRAVMYLRSAQAEDGGFGNVSATAWVIQGLIAAGENTGLWGRHHSYLTPEYYLATQQERDGGMSVKTADQAKRAWETAYAIPAAQHKTWDALLGSFPKPAPVPVATSTVPATTTAPATSTARVSTSFTTVNKVEQPAAAPTAESAPEELPTAARSTSTPEQTPSAQTAAANATGMFDVVWRAITSFVSSLF